VSIEKLSPREIDRPSPEAVDDLPRHPLVGLLDNIRSIYNVGSIFRTSDAVRVRKLYLTGITGTPEHKDLHKTALGAQDAVPWERADDPIPLVKNLQANDYTVAALEITNQPTRIREIQLEDFPLCLIVGNEVQGVQDPLLSQVDLALELPQYGIKHSFNVAVAYGIASYNLVQRYRTLRARI
jgi:tRNA G18 (ribose-2'-O)-methylase SpoU